MRKRLRCRNAAPRRCRLAAPPSFQASPPCWSLSGRWPIRSSGAEKLWIGSTSTDFGTPKNWMPQTVPGKTDTAVFDTSKGSKGLTVTGAAGFENQAIIVRNGSFSLSAAGGTYTVTAANDSVLVGENAGDTGSLKLTAGTLAGDGGHDRLGCRKHGYRNDHRHQIDLEQQRPQRRRRRHGRADSPERRKNDGYRGRSSAAPYSGSNGTATVTGGSSWQAASTLFIGDAGTGTLRIQNKGMVTSLDAKIGDFAGSNGTVTVTGESKWTMTGELDIGVAGTAKLTIRNAGVVNNGNAMIGVAPGSDGTVTVNGLGSIWNSGDLDVGSRGAGELIVRNRAVVSDSIGTIGVFAGSTGMVTVNGTGSEWDSTSDLIVGNVGSGTLLIKNGGLVTNKAGTIGNFTGSDGTVTVTGTGSKWINFGPLDVGGAGKALDTLSVENGGLVTSKAGTIGNVAGTNGMVTVTAPGRDGSTRAHSKSVHRAQGR